MIKHPLISIITATHNRPEQLQSSAQSVLGQNYTKWELLVINDSTNEKSDAILDDLDSHPQVTVIQNEKNIGLAASRNKGLDAAEGTWITFLDDDDTLADAHALDRVVETITKHKAPWFAFNRVDETGKSFTKPLTKKSQYNWTKDFLFGRNFRGDAVHFLSQKLLGKTRYTGTQRAQWKFWFILSQKSDFVHKAIPVTQAEYEETGLSSSRSLAEERVYMRQQFFEMSKRIETLKYLPVIAGRYLFTLPPLRQARQLLKR